MYRVPLTAMAAALVALTGVRANFHDTCGEPSYSGVHGGIITATCGDGHGGELTTSLDLNHCLEFNEETRDLYFGPAGGAIDVCENSGGCLNCWPDVMVRCPDMGQGITNENGHLKCYDWVGTVVA